MSKQALYCPPADQNPVDLTLLPRGELQTAFPVNSPIANSKQTTALLLGSLVFVTSFPFGLLLLSYKSILFTYALLIFVPPVLVVLWDSLLRAFGHLVALAVILGCLPAYAPLCLYFEFRGSPPDISTAVFVVGPLLACFLLIRTASAFRSHWLHVSSCGMIPQAIRDEFRRTGKLPPEITPRAGGFWQALKSFVCYDQRDTKVKGLEKTPDSARKRLLLLIFSIHVLGLVCDRFVAHQLPHWLPELTSTSDHELEPLAEQAAGALPQESTEVSVSSKVLISSLPWIVAIAVTLLPTLTAVGACYLSSSDIADSGYALSLEQFDNRHWESFVSDLHTSSNTIEKESIYLGRVGSDGSPILLPSNAFGRHAWIQGASGKGKTVLLTQILEQLVGLGYSVVTIDNKATSFELLWSARVAAHRARRSQGRHVPVIPFTTVTGYPTYLLDMFEQRFWTSRSPEEKSSGILGIFGMNYPQVYGQDYFRDAAWAVVQHVYSKYPNLGSFWELGQHLMGELQWAKEPWELSRSVKEHGEHPRLIVNRLGMIDAINSRPTYMQEILDNSIDLRQLFLKPTVLHCALPSEVDPVGNPEIGRLVLASLFSTAASMRKRPVKVIVLIDEFQRMIARSLDLVIQQARSSDIGLIFTNQTSSDLKLPDCDLFETLCGNTSVQIWLSAADLKGSDQVVKLAGQYIDNLITRTVSHGPNGKSESVTLSEHVFDRLNSTSLDEVGADPSKFILRINDNVGYCAYKGHMFVAQMDYHTSRDEHIRRSQPRKWPKYKPGMLVNGDHRPPSGPPQSSLTGPARPKSPPPPTKLAPADQRQRNRTNP